MSTKCPHCGASNPESALWCNQCFGAFASDPTPSSSVVAPTPASPPVPVPDSDFDSETLVSDPVPPDHDAMRANEISTTDTQEADAVAEASGATWTCQTCDAVNPVALNLCSVCGTSIFEAFGATEDGKPEITERQATLWALIPGMGHSKAGFGLLGLTVAMLIGFTFFSSVGLIASSQLVASAFFGLVTMALWGVSIVDAVALSDGRKPLLEGRVITYLAGGLVAIIIILVISQLGSQ